MIYSILNNIKDNLNAAPAPLDMSSEMNFIPAKDSINNRNGIYITLLNINEETANKIPFSNRRNAQDNFQTENPSLTLDLFVIMSGYNPNYGESLKLIDKVIQFFVNRYHFSFLNDGAEIEYSLKMVNLSLEQNNNLWQALSNNIMPHVIYKVKSTIITPLAVNQEVVPEVIEININSKKL